MSARDHTHTLSAPALKALGMDYGMEQQRADALKSEMLRAQEKHADARWLEQAQHFNTMLIGNSANTFNNTLTFTNTAPAPVLTIRPPGRVSDLAWLKQRVKEICDAGALAS